MKLRSVLFAALGVGFLLSASAPAALAQHWHGGGGGWHGGGPGWHGHVGWWGGRWWGPGPYYYGPRVYYAPPYPYYYGYPGPVVTFGVR
jgi:hypothetical protein